MFLLLLTGFLTTTNAAELITVYGDVHKDVKFFTSTFPWIIDNIGGDLIIDYFLLGSGKYSVPQMCALQQLRENTFLQAQYLKCEAERIPSEYCLCETGIDPEIFKQCVASGGHLASLAAANYSDLDLKYNSPVIDLGPKSTVFAVDDKQYLQKICTIFGDNKPLGCDKPIHCDRSENFPHKRAVAHFDRDCYENILINWVDEESCEEDSEESDISESSENGEPGSGIPESSEYLEPEIDFWDSFEIREPLSDILESSGNGEPGSDISESSENGEPLSDILESSGNGEPGSDVSESSENGGSEPETSTPRKVRRKRHENVLFKPINQD